MLLILERHRSYLDCPNVGKRCRHRFKTPDLLRFDPEELYGNRWITRILLALVDKRQQRKGRTEVNIKPRAGGGWEEIDLTNFATIS
ncbi:hypothetical protein I6F07_32230 [Ensifer sp. IC4062]|nr:hypothetical protein [Ensifer sp. IC4062]MCA1444754.1 hypothetical protein [Ensifer sp. IC4062]